MILSHPHPSTDGKKLFVAGVQPRVELTRFDLRSKQFVPFLEGISARWPDFTRDGEWVTYTDYPKDTLWRMKLDGSQRLQLTQPPMLTMHPRWSPDGKQIAFMGLVSGKPWKIYLISADGGTLQQLTTEDRTEGDPTWSPDGNSLVFCLFPTPENPILPLYLYDLTTRQASPLPGSEGLWKPRWSPDGRYIAAAYGSDDKLALYDFTTRKLEQVADVPRARPTWSRDGKYVYFRKVYGENQAIYRLRISDRKIELLTSLEGFREFSRYNVTFSLAPDDSILLVRNVSINEIYALDWEER